MSKIINGSSLRPLSGGQPKQIVLMLHGYGSNGADLISLAPHWQHALPDALFLAPNAPQRFSAGRGFQWWPLSALSPVALAAGAAAAAPALDAFIDRKLDQYGLSEANLAIVGFSQGTMMALHIGLRRKGQVAGIVGYSGMLTDAADLSHRGITKPPVLLIHGADDPYRPRSVAKYCKARARASRHNGDLAYLQWIGTQHRPRRFAARWRVYSGGAGIERRFTRTAPAGVNISFKSEIPYL